MNGRSDVVIVGAGPSGAVVAPELARAVMSVTVLEQGDWVPTEAFDGARPEWELTQLRKWHPNGDDHGGGGAVCPEPDRAAGRGHAGSVSGGGRAWR